MSLQAVPWEALNASLPLAHAWLHAHMRTLSDRFASPDATVHLRVFAPRRLLCLIRRAVWIHTEPAVRLRCTVHRASNVSVRWFPQLSAAAAAPARRENPLPPLCALYMRRNRAALAHSHVFVKNAVALHARWPQRFDARQTIGAADLPRRRRPRRLRLRRTQRRRTRPTAARMASAPLRSALLVRARPQRPLQS